jgi:hypothetical protein
MREQGAALITALIFLIIITMLSLTAMRSSMLELRQASNDEIRVAAFESAQAIIDAVLDTPAGMPVVGEVGDRTCAGAYGPECTNTGLTLPGALGYGPYVEDELVKVVVERLAPAYRPPPRGLGTSARMLTAAAFRIDATYDLAEDGRGSAEVTQGVLIVVPKGN